jgi:hypothetical protein
VGLDALWCGVTLDKISRVARPLMQASAGIACLALLWDACAPRIPRLRDLAGRAIGPSALSVALAALALLWIAPWPPLHEASQLFRATLRYLGPALAVCAFAGALFFLLDPQVLRDARALLLVALVLSAALLVHSHIVPIYPWATRRFVSFCLPALAVLAAAVPARLWKRGGRLAWTGWALSAALVAAPMRDAQAAWQITEYDGVTAALSEAVRQLPEDAVVIADHHWWGAPLIHLHGKAVINGARLWQPASPDGREAAWQAMSRLRASGFHFVFLTSTPEGIGVYPDPVEGAKLLWSGEPLTLCELMHHRKPIGFVAREHPVEFRVYDWPLSSPAAGR